MSLVPKKIVDKQPSSQFTEDQRKAYVGLLEFLDAPYNSHDYKRALVGAAGTGKTFLLRSLIKNCNFSYSVIGIAAPTHKACRVLSDSIMLREVKINTLQSDLGLRLNFDVEKFDIKHPPFDPKSKIKIGNYKVYIVDEASMINKDLLTFLENSCVEHKCKLILVGDASQLAPVNEKYIPAFKSIKTFNLQQVVRQGDDNPITYLLKLLRYDIQHNTFNFLNYISVNRSSFNEDNTKGYCVLNSEKFQNIVNVNFSDDNLTRNIDFVKLIAYTNYTVSSWNKWIRHNIIKDSDKCIVTKNDLFISYVTIVNDFNECIIKNSEEYIVKDVVNYTHPKYAFKGYLVKFISIHGGIITSPLFILDHKDAYSVAMYVKATDQMVERAKHANVKLRADLWKEFYKFRDSCLLLTNVLNQDGTIKYSRDLDYGFCMTSHKSQGSTFDTALVDVDDIVYNRYGVVYPNAEEINRRLYVACSRAKNKLYLKFHN